HRARGRVPLRALRLPAGGRAGQGAQRDDAVGADARRLVRDRRVRPEDRPAEAGDPQEPRARLAEPGPVGQVTARLDAAGRELRATVEVTTWVTKLVGGDGTGSRVSDEAFAPGETIRDVLTRYSRRFPELDAALWGPGRAALGEHIEVLVDDAVLGVKHELDTALQGGERITL